MSQQPTFYCRDWLETQNYVHPYKVLSCTEQCDECVNAIIDHHKNKAMKDQQPEQKTAEEIINLFWKAPEEYRVYSKILIIECMHAHTSQQTASLQKQLEEQREEVVARRDAMVRMMTISTDKDNRITQLEEALKQAKQILISYDTGEDEEIVKWLNNIHKSLQSPPGESGLNKMDEKLVWKRDVTPPGESEKENNNHGKK